MRKYCVISTGGTIASSKGSMGLAPALSGKDLIARVPDLALFQGEIEVVDLMSKDSSNMNPLDWVTIARCVKEKEGDNLSFIVLHGTDTMAYTASALSFLLCDSPRPVILTGSMLPMEEPGSDGPENILNSFLFAQLLIERGQPGVSIAFSGKLIHGPRSEKIVSKEKTAFDTINYPLLGKIIRGRAVIDHRPVLSGRSVLGHDEYRPEKNIILIKIYPGFQASFLEHLINMSPRAVLIESLGLGGVPFIGENLLPPLALAQQRGIPVVLTTQCVYGGVDLSVYEVGRKTLELGVISGKDMTRETLVTKLMIMLPLTPHDEVALMLDSNYCDEVS